MAGLFGTANDLAKLFQMYLQKGYYGGKRYISEETVNRFIKIQFPENNNRRGLGFDKPLINNNKKSIKMRIRHLMRAKTVLAIPDLPEPSFGQTLIAGCFMFSCRTGFTPHVRTENFLI
jgi:CubicO group peptidase (beta-lactamase class C family)